MLPAGFVEYGEFAEDTAIREAKEETGLDVVLVGLAGLYYGTDDPRNPSHLALYVAHITGGELQAGDDAIDARFFAPDDVPPNIAFHAHRQAVRHWRTQGFEGLAPLVGADPE
jgi:8-oxo-dGTP diphosphatase